MVLSFLFSFFHIFVVCLFDFEFFVIDCVLISFLIVLKLHDYYKESISIFRLLLQSLSLCPSVSVSLYIYIYITYQIGS